MKLFICHSNVSIIYNKLILDLIFNCCYTFLTLTDRSSKIENYFKVTCKFVREMFDYYRYVEQTS